MAHASRTYHFRHLISLLHVVTFLHLILLVFGQSSNVCRPIKKDANHKKFIDSIVIEARQFTMTSLSRLHNTRDLSLDVIYNGIQGDFVETGVWKGGNSMITRAASLVTNTTACRHNWLFDSYAGLPEEGMADLRAAQRLSTKTITKKMDIAGSYSFGINGVKKVQHNFDDVFNGKIESHKGSASSIHFVQGWFKDTVFTANIQHIAILRLDGDMYASTMDVLHAFYHKVTPGGYVVIDNYGHWPQCKLAIHDFFDKELNMNIASKLIRIDYTGYYFKKPFVTVQNTFDAADHIKHIVVTKKMQNFIRLPVKVTERFSANERYVRNIKAGYTGHVGNNPHQLFEYYRMVKNASSSISVPFVVCETGFNGGHSASLFLEANKNVIYYGWDLGIYSAAKPMAIKMNEEIYPGRVHVSWGNSKIQLPTFFEQHPNMICDFVSIDGEHSEAGVQSDISTLVSHVRSGGLIVVDDCASPYSGIMKSYLKFVSNGKIEHLKWFKNINMGSPGFCVGRFI